MKHCFLQLVVHEQTLQPTVYIPTFYYRNKSEECSVHVDVQIVWGFVLWIIKLSSPLHTHAHTHTHTQRERERERERPR